MNCQGPGCFGTFEIVYDNGPECTYKGASPDGTSCGPCGNPDYTTCDAPYLNCYGC